MGRGPLSFQPPLRPLMPRPLASMTAVLLAACSSPPPMPAVAYVDLPRFMGDWYVIAHIPSWPERNAYAAVESYRLLPDGRVQTEFRYQDGGFGQATQTMRPVGSVRPGTGNAIWGMQFIWPIQAEYVIAYLDADYQDTIIARSKRDYVWIMARAPCISEARYQALASRVAALGYTQPLRRVPQEALSASCADAAGCRPDRDRPAAATGHGPGSCGSPPDPAG